MLNRLMFTHIRCLFYCRAHSMCHGFVNVSYFSPTLHTFFSWKCFSRLPCHEIELDRLVSITQFFCPPSLPPYMTIYLVSRRAEIIPAGAPVPTLFWSMAPIFRLFSLCTTHSLLSPTFFLVPYLYVLYLSTLFCLFLTICAVSFLSQLCTLSSFSPYLPLIN